MCEYPITECIFFVIFRYIKTKYKIFSRFLISVKDFYYIYIFFYIYLTAISDIRVGFASHEELNCVKCSMRRPTQQQLESCGGVNIHSALYLFNPFCIRWFQQEKLLLKIKNWIGILVNYFAVFICIGLGFVYF